MKGLRALTLQKWVEALLENEIDNAQKLSLGLFEENYPIYVSRDLPDAKRYVQEKYLGELDKTYGLMASSKSIILPKFGLKNDFDSTRFKPEYYIDSNSPYYCCRLIQIVTEFGCQGLELDMPLLAWEADWIYNRGWQNKAPSTKAKDPNNLKKNAYRVLLTRGRDGLVLYIPEYALLDQTYSVLLSAGCKKL